MDLKTEKRTKDKNGQNTMLQGTVRQEHIIVVFFKEAPNIGAPNI